MILERAVPDWKSKVQAASNFFDIATVIKTLFDLQTIPGQEPPKDPNDYKDEGSDYGLKVKGIKARERINAQAREVITRVQDPGDLTDKDREVLKQYSGRGGLTENSQFEYYTPTHVAEGLWDGIMANGFQNGNVLDPCTGAGVFSATKPKGAIITGADIDPVGSKVSQLLNPGDLIKNQSFEKTVMETPDDSFDAVVGNVPFGNARGASAHEDQDYKDEKRIERYFILRALDKVKPGGLCCFVVPINIVGAKGGQWEKFRIAVSKKAEFLGAHKLPSKTFSTQGTDTVVDIVVFRKHPREFLDKADTIPFNTLKAAKVVWDEFISGQYWIGEGRPFIMGKWVPKIEGDRWSREVVDGDIDNASLKARLAQRFDSRIDWDLLETAEPIIRNYAEGDRKIINGVEYEMKSGQWSRVIKIEDTSLPIDKERYGAGTLDELKAALSSSKGALVLSAKQVFAVFKAFPEFLSPLQKASIEFAMSQPKEEYQEQIFRGSIIGGMIARYQNAMNDGTTEDVDRLELQELVAKEIDTYGHPKNNKGLLITGESSKMFGLFRNAVDEKGKFSDLLSGTIDGSGGSLEYDSTNLQAIVEHLFVREGIQEIELEDVQKLYTGKREIKSLSDLADDDALAITPDGLIVPMGRYTVGDIYPKVQAMNDALAVETDEKLKDKYMRQIDEIMRRRKTTKPEDISFDMRQKWYSKKYVVDFLRENGYPRLSYGVLEEAVREDPYSGKQFTTSVLKEDYENPFGRFYGIDDSKGGFPKQFLKYLNGENVTSSGEDAQERIKEYKDRCRVLEEQFNVWMQQHTEINEITEQYNRKFNGFTAFDYEDADLKLKDVSPQVRLHGYQNAAVRRLSEEGRGILAHNVGLGKTYSALGLYAYNRKLGRSKKTCITVPKSVLGNWYHESKKFLGTHDNVLFVGFEPKVGKDGQIEQEVVKDEKGSPKLNKYTGQFEYQDVLVERNSKEDVWEAMWKIPQANFSLVVMTKEKFGMIPMRPDSKRSYADKMVQRSLISEKMHAAAIAENAQPAENEKGRQAGKVSYDEDVAKTRLEQQFSDEGTAKKDELPYFEDMGFTDVIIDECHEFKNNMLGGEHYQDVAYLPTAPPAKRALDMTMKMAYLRDSNNGRGAYMLSATPVTNSPFEIFNMLSYVCPLEEFERYGIYTPDDFIRTFGNITSVDKMMVDGSIKSKDGLTGFKMLDGLRTMFHKYVNMKSAEDFPDQIKLPPHEEVNLDIELTEEQKRAYESLRERAKEAAKPPQKGEKKESMFSVIRDMDRVTTDMDLYNKTMTFIFRGSDKENVDALVKSLPKTIKVKRVLDDEEMEALGLDPEMNKGRAQEITIKLEISSRMENGNYVAIFPKEYENMVVDRIPQNNIAIENVSHPLMPKYARLIENLRSDLEADGKQIIFTEEKSQHQKILRLVVHHIPTIAKLIGIINAEEAKGEELQKISDEYNSGNLKFVICNKKAEVGVNLQKGTTAIHHLTLPWTPASIQQRNGRGVRQGNTAPMIHVYYYCGKGSFDAYRLEILKAKSNWMSDLFNGTEATAENANALSQDEMMDMLEADPEAAKKRRLERLAARQAEEAEKERRRLANQLQMLSQASADLAGLDAEKEAERERLQKRIPELEAEIKRLQERGLATEGDERARLGSQIIDKQQTLKNFNAKLGSLDQTFEDKRVRLTSVVKQTSGLLKQKAKKGQLPFNESLIEKPENACVTLSGKVVAVDDCYEYKDDYEQGIIKVVAVDPVRRSFKYEDITGRIGTRDLERAPDNWGWYLASSLSRMEEKGLKKVSYSEKELNLKRALSEEHDYESLVDGKLDKETFLDHRNDIRWSVYSQYVVRGQDGKIAVVSGSDFRNSEKGLSAAIIYPEKGNEDFRKGVCEAYLAARRDGDTYSMRNIMESLFGKNYDEVALGYGKKATDSEVLEVCAKAWADYTKDQQYGYASMDELVNDLADGKTRLGYILKEVANLAGSRTQDLGDNISEIGNIVHQYTLDLQTSLERAIQVKKEEKERSAQEALKADPRFKDVPQEAREAFAKLGITVKTNMTGMALPGFKGRRGAVLEPFARWFFQDRNGKSGVLYRTKDILKARYGAQFFSDAGEAFEGAWWHVPSSTDLKAIYELIA
jgi:SNF2 family DNA or RNA helicase